MVKYRDVVDIAEEASDSDREEQIAQEAQDTFEEELEEYEFSEFGEIREDDAPNQDTAFEEHHWHQEESIDFPIRNRPFSPSPSVLSHYSRSSAHSNVSMASNASSSSFIGRLVPGNMRNFFMRIFASISGSKNRSAERSDESMQSNAPSVTMSRPISPTFSHTRLPSRPVSPDNTSVANRMAWRSNRPGSRSPIFASQRVRINDRSLSPESTSGGRRVEPSRSVSPSSSFLRRPMGNVSARSGSPESVVGSVTSAPAACLRPGSPTNAAESSFRRMGSHSVEGSVRGGMRGESPPRESSQRNLVAMGTSQRSLNPRLAGMGSSQRSVNSNQSFLNRNLQNMGTSQRSLNGAAAQGALSDKPSIGGSLRKLLGSKPKPPPNPEKKRLQKRLGGKYCNAPAMVASGVLDLQGFAEVDIDGSGKVSFDEFRRTRFGAALSVEDARRAFDKIDTDKSGSIDADEWKAWTKFKAERALRKKLVTSEVLVEELLAS